MAYPKLQKHLNYLFLNTTPDAGAGKETWARVGKSTEWTDTMNAKTSTYEYIEDSGPTDVIDNYQPSTNMPLTAHVGEPVYEYIFAFYVKQEVNATTKAMRVFQNKAADGTKQIAQVTDCTITIDNFNFATGIITFTIKQGGTPTLGTATIAEKIAEKNTTGGTYCKKDSFVSGGKVYININDLDFFKLLNRVSSYITVWESQYGATLMVTGKNEYDIQMLEKEAKNGEKAS